uniref:Mucin-like domain-containing protein n=1 Tax=Knipowitschia caucasica TaxID=637954 RepID=A0AAV2L0J2_KNICA
MAVVFSSITDRVVPTYANLCQPVLVLKDQRRSVMDNMSQDRVPCPSLSRLCLRAVRTHFCAVGTRAAHVLPLGLLEELQPHLTVWQLDRLQPLLNRRGVSTLSAWRNILRHMRGPSCVLDVSGEDEAKLLVMRGLFPSVLYDFNSSSIPKQLCGPDHSALLCVAARYICHFVLLNMEPPLRRLTQENRRVLQLLEEHAVSVGVSHSLDPRKAENQMALLVLHRLLDHGHVGRVVLEARCPHTLAWILDRRGPQPLHPYAQVEGLRDCRGESERGPACSNTAPEQGPACSNTAPEPGPSCTSTAPEPGPSCTSTAPERGPSCTSTAPERGPSCTSTAPGRGPSCTSTAPEPGPSCTSTTPEQGPSCSSTAPERGPSCTSTTPERGPSCTSTAPERGPSCTSTAPGRGPSCTSTAPEPGPSCTSTTPEQGPSCSSTAPERGPSCTSTAPEPGPSCTSTTPEQGPSCSSTAPEQGPSCTSTTPEQGPSCSSTAPEQGPSCTSTTPEQGPSCSSTAPEQGPSCTSTTHGIIPIGA